MSSGHNDHASSRTARPARPGRRQRQALRAGERPHNEVQSEYQARLSSIRPNYSERERSPRRRSRSVDRDSRRRSPLQDDSRSIAREPVEERSRPRWRTPSPARRERSRSWRDRHYQRDRSRSPARPRRRSRSPPRPRRRSPSPVSSRRRSRSPIRRREDRWLPESSATGNRERVGRIEEGSTSFERSRRRRSRSDSRGRFNSSREYRDRSRTREYRRGPHLEHNSFRHVSRSPLRDMRSPPPGPGDGRVPPLRPRQTMPSDCIIEQVEQMPDPLRPIGNDLGPMGDAEPIEQTWSGLDFEARPIGQAPAAPLGVGEQQEQYLDQEDQTMLVPDDFDQGGTGPGWDEPTPPPQVQADNSGADQALGNDNVIDAAIEAFEAEFRQVSIAEGKSSDEVSLFLGEAGGSPITKRIISTLRYDRRKPAKDSWYESTLIEALVENEPRGSSEVHFSVSGSLAIWLRCWTRDEDVIDRPIKTREAHLSSQIGDVQMGRDTDQGFYFPFADMSSDKTTVLFPYNPSGSHWVAVEAYRNIDSGEGFISIFNPAKPAQRQGQALTEGKRELPLLLMLASLREDSPFHGVKWSAENVRSADCPQQSSDGVDCGPLVAMILAARFHQKHLVQATDSIKIRNFSEFTRVACARRANALLRGLHDCTLFEQLQAWDPLSETTGQVEGASISCNLEQRSVEHAPLPSLGGLLQAREAAEHLFVTEVSAAIRSKVDNQEDDLLALHCNDLVEAVANVGTLHLGSKNVAFKVEDALSLYHLLGHDEFVDLSNNVVCALLVDEPALPCMRWLHSADVGYWFPPMPLTDRLLFLRHEVEKATGLFMPEGMEYPLSTVDASMESIFFIWQPFPCEQRAVVEIALHQATKPLRIVCYNPTPSETAAFTMAAEELCLFMHLASLHPDSAFADQEWVNAEVVMAPCVQQPLDTKIHASVFAVLTVVRRLHGLPALPDEDDLADCEATVVRIACAVHLWELSQGRLKSNLLQKLMKDSALVEEDAPLYDRNLQSVGQGAGFVRDQQDSGDGAGFGGYSWQEELLDLVGFQETSRAGPSKTAKSRSKSRPEASRRSARLAAKPRVVHVQADTGSGSDRNRQPDSSEPSEPSESPESPGPSDTGRNRRRPLYEVECSICHERLHTVLPRLIPLICVHLLKHNEDIEFGSATRGLFSCPAIDCNHASKILQHTRAHYATQHLRQDLNSQGMKVPVCCPRGGGCNMVCDNVLDVGEYDAFKGHNRMKHKIGLSDLQNPVDVVQTRSSADGPKRRRKNYWRGLVCPICQLEYPSQSDQLNSFIHHILRHETSRYTFYAESGPQGHEVFTCTWLDCGFSADRTQTGQTGLSYSGKQVVLKHYSVSHGREFLVEKGVAVPFHCPVEGCPQYWSDSLTQLAEISAHRQLEHRRENTRSRLELAPGRLDSVPRPILIIARSSTAPPKAWFAGQESLAVGLATRALEWFQVYQRRTGDMRLPSMAILHAEYHMSTRYMPTVGSQEEELQKENGALQLSNKPRRHLTKSVKFSDAITKDLHAAADLDPVIVSIVGEFRSLMIFSNGTKGTDGLTCNTSRLRDWLERVPPHNYFVIWPWKPSQIAVTQTGSYFTAQYSSRELLEALNFPGQKVNLASELVNAMAEIFAWKLQTGQVTGRRRNERPGAHDGHDYEEELTDVSNESDTEFDST